MGKIGTPIFLILVSVALMTMVFYGSDRGKFTNDEKNLIKSSGSIMRVLSVDNQEDSLILRQKSTDLSKSELGSELHSELAEKMLRTVQAEQYNGVGLAAPQVGISRRIVAVCRMDKEGEPFEVYSNIQIDSLTGPKVSGREGCLSVPGYRGSVDRYQRIIISYDEIGERKSECVEGFTAVIFQHECDHLDGIIYTDKAEDISKI